MSYYRGERTRKHPIEYGVDLTPASYTPELKLDIRGKNQLGEFIVEDPIGIGSTRQVYNALRLGKPEVSDLTEKSKIMHASAIENSQKTAEGYMGGMRDQLMRKFANGLGSGYNVPKIYSPESRVMQRCYIQK